VFWVISVYFNIRNNLPKSGTFLLGHPVYGDVYYQAVNVMLLSNESERGNCVSLYLERTC
jgi:hypothetical protein